MPVRVMAIAVAAIFAATPASAQQSGKTQQQGGKTQQSGKKDTGKSKQRVAQGPKQRHQCKVGPYEKQTRLVMETVRNKPVYLAYWSSNGPFHCSFETWPGDGRAQWVDSKAGTVINLISGTMLIERNGDKYYVHARDVDRMPYCGTFGLISGVLTIPTKKGQCDWKETSSDEAGQLLQEETPPAEAAPAPPRQDTGVGEAGPSVDAGSAVIGRAGGH